MLRKPWTLAVIVASLGSAPLAARQEAVLKRIEVPGAAFDLLLALPKSPPQLFYDLSESPDALVVHLIGGELVLSFEDAAEMIEAAQALREPIGASRAAGNDAISRIPFAVYAVGKRGEGAPHD